MQIYNTMTRKKEELVPLIPGQISMYVCGPTVYNFFHIGNARPFVVFDTFRRYLEYRGYKVRFIQNFTDIDDKLIRRAKEENTTVPELAERYIKEYYTDADALGVERATNNPRATQHIPQIVALVQALIDKGHAYATGDGDVYFSVRSFKDYGKLSGQSIEDLGERRPHRAGRKETGSAGFRPVEGRKARRACLGNPLGHGPARLAHRMLRHEHGTLRPHLRHPRRWPGPGFPPP